MFHPAVLRALAAQYGCVLCDPSYSSERRYTFPLARQWEQQHLVFATVLLAMENRVGKTLHTEPMSDRQE